MDRPQDPVVAGQGVSSVYTWVDTLQDPVVAGQGVSPVHTWVVTGPSGRWSRCLTYIYLSGHRTQWSLVKVSHLYIYLGGHRTQWSLVKMSHLYTPEWSHYRTQWSLVKVSHLYTPEWTQDPVVAGQGVSPVHTWVDTGPSGRWSRCLTCTHLSGHRTQWSLVKVSHLYTPEWSQDPVVAGQGVSPLHTWVVTGPSGRWSRCVTCTHLSGHRTQWSLVKVSHLYTPEWTQDPVVAGQGISPVHTWVDTGPSGHWSRCVTYIWVDTGPSGRWSRCVTCTHLSGHTTGPSGRWSRCITCTHLSGHRTQWSLVKVSHLCTPEWSHYRTQWSLVKVSHLYTPEWTQDPVVAVQGVSPLHTWVVTGPSGRCSRCITCKHLSGHITGPSGRWSRCVTCTHLSGHRTQWSLVKVSHLYTPEWTQDPVVAGQGVSPVHTWVYTGPSGRWSRCLTCTHLSGHRTQWSLVKVCHLYTPECTQDPVVTGQDVSPLHTWVDTGPSGHWSRCLTSTHLSGRRTQWSLVKVSHLYTPEWTQDPVVAGQGVSPVHTWVVTGPSGHWSRCLTCTHLSGHGTQWSLVEVSHLYTPEWTQDPVVAGQGVSPVHTWVDTGPSGHWSRCVTCTYLSGHRTQWSLVKVCHLTFWTSPFDNPSLISLVVYAYYTRYETVK